MGQAPGGIVIAAVVSELKKRPEFYGIFANNSYEEIVAQLEPFKETETIKFDYGIFYDQRSQKSQDTS